MSEQKQQYGVVRIIHPSTGSRLAWIPEEYEGKPLTRLWMGRDTGHDTVARSGDDPASRDAEVATLTGAHGWEIVDDQRGRETIPSMPLSLSEIRVLAALGLPVDRLERRSARPFDLGISGRHEDGLDVRFSAWLPLAYVRKKVRWWDRDVAARTDYPEMARQGDWSAVRDSSTETIWALFEETLNDHFPGGI